jgi:hypothetical protein
MDQESARLDEYLDENTYDKLSIHDLKPPVRKKSDSGRGAVETLDFRVPLEAVGDNEKASESNKPSPTWQLPAMACPPVWWIVVDGTVSPSTHGVEAANNYWNTLGSALEKALDDVPPHVHVGMVTATTSRLACWDFMDASSSDEGCSILAQVKHYPYSLLESEASFAACDLSLVPADDCYKPGILEAIQTMVQAGISGTFYVDNQMKADETKEGDVEQSNIMSGFPLGTTIEVLLQFMEQAMHPGREDNSTNNETLEGSASAMRYAGGKILCLIGSPPMEITPLSDDCMATVSQPLFHQGGAAGACFVDDDRLKWKSTQPQQDVDNDVDPTDMTATNLKDYAKPLEPEEVFEKIGKKCARAALGVDLMVLVPESNELSRSTIPWYGLPLLRVLSDTSGAPGPLMHATARDNDRFMDNVLSRTPWQNEMAFGCQMRLRISPGFEVEDSTVEKESKMPLQLAPFLSSGGLMGPAHVVESTDNDSGLWVMGTSDAFTSYTVDLQAAANVKDRFHVDGFGEVALRPVIQTCFEYTCIETDGGEDDPTFYTVRKMRISNLPLTLVDEAEPIYDALDLEALAAVLFHKISLDAYLSGLHLAQKTAESWLRSLLTCVYQSAQMEQAKIEEEVDKRHGLQSASTSATAFVAKERLLDQDGDLEVQDVLMGYGHPKIAAIPLLCYALMQCDALRPSSGEFLPSMDSRLCAIAQMASMPPSVLAKSIAPSIILWSMKDDEAIVESLPLSKRGIVDALGGITNSSDEVLLIDSPRAVFLLPPAQMDTNKEKGKKGKKFNLDVGPNLESYIVSSLKAFRTVPSNWKDLESILGGNQPTEMLSHTIESFFLEDKPVATGFQNFSEWKMELALLVQEDLEGTGDI